MSEERIQALEAEVTSLRALVSALVVVLHEQRIASVSKTSVVERFVRSGLPALFPEQTPSEVAPTDKALAFIKMEPDESPLVRLVLETIHQSKHAEVVREHLEHSMDHDGEALGEHLARELKRALELDRIENEGGRGSRPPGKR